MTFPYPRDAGRFNPNHAPAGSPTGGQFAPASGSSSSSGKAAQDKKKQPAKDTRATPGNANPVGLGERGQRVKDLQARLNALGIKPPLAVDGIFGPKTLAAVKKFQAEHGLKPDGLVGPKTTAALRAKTPAAKPAAGKPAAKAPAGKLSDKPGSVTTGQKTTVAQLLKTRKVSAGDAADMKADLGSMAESEAGALIKHLQSLPAKPAARALEIVHGPGYAARALGHEKVGHTSQGLWHHKGLQLPAFFQHVANDLISERGIPESQAVHMAVGLCEKWAHGGPDVKPETQAKAAAAVAEWNKLRAQAKATPAKRAVMADGEYDGDGLHSSWDDSSPALPDLSGLEVSHLDAAAGGGGDASRAAPVGSGARFAKLKGELAAKGAADPGALAAWIGRKKFGRAKFADLAAAARKGAGSVSRAGSPGEILRFYPLEDIHIITRAEGDGTGTMVEAYATVFDQPAEIRDHQGHYLEVIDRGAFDDVLGQIRRSRSGLAGAVKVLYNHGMTAQNTPAPEYQVPLGVPVDIVPEKRGLLTRTRYDAGDPFTDRILSKIKSGAITAQSFVGGILRSDPSLMGPGDRYRKRGGTLTTVRRMQLGLREYGPVLWPAYSGAEILGVRMQLPGDGDDLGRYAAEDEAGPDYPVDDEYTSANEEAVAGGAPGEAHASRYHQHALWALQLREILEKKGLSLLWRR